MSETNRARGSCLCSANFNLGLRYRLGIGRRSRLAKEAGGVGIRKPLVVTDAVIAALPWFEQMVAKARQDGLALAVFSDVRSNPVIGNVEDGVAAYRAGDHDGVILVGGGSAMDTGKAIALMSGHDGRLFDYEFVGNKWRGIKAAQVAPMLAVPTTSGTGSEVSAGAVITDREAGVKRTLLHPSLVPAAVIADPETTFGLSAKLTAATGMDALTHAFEALCAPMYHPIADAMALEALRLIDENLATTCAEPTNAEARTHMILASSMAAIAFQKGLGLVHAMAHPLGAVTDMHHGLANAILLPYVMVHNRYAIEPEITRIARYLGLPGDGFDTVLEWVLAMRKTLHIPHRLLGVSGIDSADLADVLAPKAMAEEGYIPYNPKPVSEAEVHEVFASAIEGRLG